MATSVHEFGTPNGTPLNVPNTLVQRDAAGNFSAGIITATINGTILGTVAASQVTAGIFGVGAYTFPDALTVTGLLTTSAGVSVAGTFDMTAAETGGFAPRVFWSRRGIQASDEWISIGTGPTATTPDMVLTAAPASGMYAVSIQPVQQMVGGGAAMLNALYLRVHATADGSVRTAAEICGLFVDGQVLDANVAATVVTGIHITNQGAAGDVNSYGLLIDDQGTAGGYAIKTGIGTVSFGGQMTVMGINIPTLTGAAALVFGGGVIAGDFYGTTNVKSGNAGYWRYQVAGVNTWGVGMGVSDGLADYEWYDYGGAAVRMRLTQAGALTVSGLLTASAGITIAAGQVLKLGNAYAAGAVVATGTVDIQDSTGTTRHLLCT